MNYKPSVGTRVMLSNGKRGTVSGYLKKPKHIDKVVVQKDGETGCNSVIMVKYKNLTRI